MAFLCLVMPWLGGPGYASLVGCEGTRYRGNSIARLATISERAEKKEPRTLIPDRHAKNTYAGVLLLKYIAVIQSMFMRDACVYE